MKKFAMMTLGAALLLSSCGTYTGTGAYAGASLGGMVGSAIGGISGGWRGSDVGTLIGMAGGAAVGAAVGAAADQAAANRVDQYRSQRASRSYDKQPNYSDSDDDGYFDPNNGGDDRIDFGAPPRHHSDVSHSAAPVGLHAERGGISISNVRFVGEGGDDRAIRPGSLNKISFEVRNTSSRALYNIHPQVIEISRNRHIQVSQGISVESIAPGRGVRYTAMVKADRRLKDGMATFQISVYNPASGHSVEIDNIQIMTCD